MKNFRLILSFLIPVFIFSCNDTKKNIAESDDPPVARVYDQFLYQSELNSLIGPSATPSDSALIVTRYIESWIRNRLILHKAEETLSGEEKDVDKQLKDYRNSLLIYKYEKLLIERKLDTLVTEEAIVDYYNQHKNNFELRNNILIGRFAKIEYRSNWLDTIKAFIGTKDTDKLIHLEEICYEHALKYSISDTSWILFSNFFKEIPINVYNEESFLRTNKTGTVNDSLYSYVFYIDGYRTAEEISPINFVRNDIKRIILNKKGISMLDSNYINIYQQAIQQNEFEIY